MKIAIPVEADDEQIAVRMGYAVSFSVYTIDKDKIEKLGVYENKHVHRKHGEGHHHDHDSKPGTDVEGVYKHRRDLGIIKECDAVIVRGVGPSMKEALLAENIDIFRARKALGETAEALIQNFLNSPNKFQKIT